MGRAPKLLWSAMLGSKTPTPSNDGTPFSDKLSLTAARVKRFSASSTKSFGIDMQDTFTDRVENRIRRVFAKPLKSCLKTTQTPEHRGPKSSPRVWFPQDLIDELNLKALSAMDFRH